MATTNDWVNERVYLTGTNEERVRAMMDHIAKSLGLTLDFENRADDNNLALYYEYSSIPNLGIMFHTSALTSSSNAWFYISVIYKDNTGAWHVANSEIASGRANMTHSVICNHIKVGNFTTYVVGDMHTNNAWNMTFWFIPFTIIDYFSNEQRKGFLHSMPSSHGLITYNDSTHTAEYLGSRCLNTSYPSSRALTVATPYAFQSDSLFGYIGSATTLYHINMASGDVGEQIQLAGHTFMRLFDMYWVRLN